MRPPPGGPGNILFRHEGLRCSGPCAAVGLHCSTRPPRAPRHVGPALAANTRDFAHVVKRPPRPGGEHMPYGNGPTSVTPACTDLVMAGSRQYATRPFASSRIAVAPSDEVAKAPRDFSVDGAASARRLKWCQQLARAGSGGKDALGPQPRAARRAPRHRQWLGRGPPAAAPRCRAHPPQVATGSPRPPARRELVDQRGGPARSGQQALAGRRALPSSRHGSRS